MPTIAHLQTDPMVSTQTFCQRELFPPWQVGAGNITIHSRAEPRYQGSACGHTFAPSTGTPYYRLRFGPELVNCVVTLLAGGCTLAVFPAAFGLDVRTVLA